MIESSIFRDQMMIRRQERPFPNIQTDSSNSQSGVSSASLWLQSSMVSFCPEDDRAVSHSAQSTPVGDRFKPSQNSSRTRGFALVSNTGILRGGRAADEAIRWFRIVEVTKVRGCNNTATSSGGR